jgi:ABC-2 type transport system ATP-binding protein
MTAALSITGFTKRYGKKVAVEGLSLEVRPNEFMSLVGPNGAGKSTTISALTGQLVPDEGKVAIDGVDLWGDPLSAKRRLGYVAQEPGLPRHLTAREYLDFVGAVKGVEAAERERQSAELLEAADLVDAQDHAIGEYSLGMSKKVALAAALLGAPKALVLDEAFAGLDPEAVRRFRDLLTARRDKGAAVLFATHVLETVERVSDAVALIAKGRLLSLLRGEELAAVISGEGGLEGHYLRVVGARERG